MSTPPGPPSPPSDVTSRPLTPAQILRVRAAAEAAIRRYLNATGALEISVPTLVPNPGLEPHLRAFRAPAREAIALGPRWLHTSPEYAIKSVFADLDADVFAFARAYRDEPPTRWHHPEFTMLEWYRAHVGLEALMADCEAIVRATVDAVSEVLGLQGVLSQDAKAMLERPFAHLRCDEACARWAGVDLHEPDEARFAAAARAAGWSVELDWDRDTVWSVLVTDAIEPHLTEQGPAFLTAFPAWQSALARRDPADARCALRMELYVPGRWERPPWRGAIELANAFDELTDPVEQRARFEEDMRRREALDADAYPMPEALLAGVARMPRTAGIALGFERLVVWAVEWAAGHTLRVADLLLGEPLPPLR